MKQLMSVMVILLCVACGDSYESPKMKAEFSTTQPIFVERHVLDANQLKLSFDEVKKIDNEVPVLELIPNGLWDQSDFENISQLSSMETLNLNGFSVDDVDFSFLEQCPSLKQLILSNSSFTDEDVFAYVAEIPIETLNLQNSRVTAGVIDDLSEMSHLRVLVLGKHPQLKDFQLSLSKQIELH